MKLRKGDTVQVITGKDKGKQGEIDKVFPKANKVIVHGVNTASKHSKPSKANEQGGIIEIVATIHVSNVAVICPNTKQVGRVGYRFEGDTKVRYHKKSGEVLS